MKLDKKDIYIKTKLQEDKKISSKANEVFEKFEGGINLENNNKQKQRKVLKLTLSQAVMAFVSLMIVVVLGGNLYAHMTGRPNLYSAIKGLFVKEEKYVASEVVVDKTVESNGIKLTLKTVAMDENMLITKYIAEGEKLANDFYTYPEFEEEMLEYVRMTLKIADWDVVKDDDTYKNATPKDAMEAERKIESKLMERGLTKTEADELLNKAENAYKEFIASEGEVAGHSSEKAQELVSEVIAVFEAKVASRYKIMVSNDTLQGFGINSVTQKIERSGNQYIIYNMYSVDTITDLASKFKLVVDISKIGSTTGTWKFETELEKARLDTRVETIDFYENNSKEIFLGVEVGTGKRENAKAEVKRLVLSDFSSVLMIQTSMDYDKPKYGDGHPFVFIVKDENGKVVGTGALTEEQYNNSGSKYTNRILLDGVNMNTKKLYVRIYSQWELDGKMEKISLGDEVIELDIEAARNAKKPVELTQSYTSKDVQVEFKYPAEWKVTEKEGMLELVSPENLDGEVAKMTISKQKIVETAKEKYEDILESIKIANIELKSSGQKTVGGLQGYYFTCILDEDTALRILVDKEDIQYDIETLGEKTQFNRYEETLNKIIETIKFVEAEKTYREYYQMGGDKDGSNVRPLQTIRVYSDNKITIKFSKDAIDMIQKNKKTTIEAEKEYEITGIQKEIQNVYFTNDTPYYGPYTKVFILNHDLEMYFLNSELILENNNFTAKKILEYWDFSGPMIGREVDNGITGDLVTLIGGKIKRNDTEKTYTVLYDGTLEEYIPKDQLLPVVDTSSASNPVLKKWPTKEQEQQPTQPTTSTEDENQQQISTPEAFEFDNFVIWQSMVGDGTLPAIYFNDNITNYEEYNKYNIKPNVGYHIEGINDVWSETIKQVYLVSKNLDKTNLDMILILTDAGYMYVIGAYGEWEVDNYSNTLKCSVISMSDKVESVMGRAFPTELRYKTTTGKFYRVWYDSITEITNGGI